MTTIEHKCWVEYDSFVHSLIPNKPDTTYDIKETRFPYVRAPHTQNPHNHSLSRFEVFPHNQSFYSEPEPLYATQYSNFCGTYTNGFSIHTG